MQILWWSYSVLVGAAVLAGMLGLFQVGRRIGARSKADEEPKLPAGIGAMDGAVLALLGLLIAFTYSGAAARFEARRELIVNEVNCIGTAWLRIDTMPAAAQPAMRDLFRRYMDSRLDVYARLPDLDAAYAAIKAGVDLQNRIWADALAASASAPQTMIVLLPALNQMFDVANTRTAMTIMHTPALILAILVLFALSSALLIGHSVAGSRRVSWIHVLGFSLAISVTIALIVDLEYPRKGLLREDQADTMMMQMRESMG